MVLRSLKAVLLVPAVALLCVTARAQSSDNAADGGASIFSNPGQGGKWIEQFFPYNNPHLDGIYATIGRMLSVYNTGILVLASILALWAIVTFVIDSANTGVIGGGRHSVLYGPLRLVVALGLLVPFGSGYNGAQVIALKLAESGSGLANSVWKKFSPTTSAFDYSHASFANGNIDSFLQQALISEACLAATQLDDGKTGTSPGTVKIQAIYPSATHQGRMVEGEEFPLTADAGVDSFGAYSSITTEAHLIGSTANEIRVHYNRNGNDDYCGSLSLPVPVVPSDEKLDPVDQTAYAAAYLAIRPKLAGYAQKLASDIDAAVKSHGMPPSAQGVQPGEQPQSLAYIPPVLVLAPATPTTAGAASATAQIEVPQVDLPPASWEALLDKFNAVLTGATDRLQQKYITSEIEQDYRQGSDPDWIWGGSLFFKLTRLSHDDLKLRSGAVSASLPNPEILPAEMREDGVLAVCPDLRSDVFLPDYHCRPEGREATLIIKTTHQILHTLQSQRGGDALPAIDAGPTAERKNDLLSGNLIAAARLDTVVAALAQNLDANGTKSADNFDSMFHAVNIGNALYLSSSSLFHASSLASQVGGNGSSSFVLSLIACLILVPGFFLAVYLPLLPALRFFLGIATWLITIFEALVAMPVIAMVQIRTQGEGLFVQGQQGWFLLLQMLLRPVLMIFGLMAAIIIFDALYGFITWAIWSALLHVSTDPGQFGNGIEGMLELLGYLVFWSVLVYFAANLSFNAITLIPDRILLWIGSVEMGSASQAAVTGGSAQPAALSSSGSVNTASISAPPPVTVITGSANPTATVQQIGIFNGPAGTQTGTTADGRSNPTSEHFPTVSEVYIPEGTQAITTITNTQTEKTIPGRPRNPRTGDTTNFIPPVQGDIK